MIMRFIDPPEKGMQMEETRNLLRVKIPYRSIQQYSCGMPLAGRLVDIR